MESLLDGYRGFRRSVWPQRRALFHDLARDGQRPVAMVVGCSDSRVDPGMIFGAGPGELFVVRNIANLVPPYQPDSAYHGTSAAIEYGVVSLEVPNLIVLGHGMCGGIRFLLQGGEAPTDFVGPWMQVARAAHQRVLACTPAGDPASEAMQTACENEAVRLSLRNLRGFPWVAAREAAGTLRLHGATFDIRTGILQLMQADGRFVAVAE